MVNPFDIHKYLGPIDFPIGKDDLVAVARTQGAPEPLLKIIENFTDKQYLNEDEVVDEAQKQSSFGLL